jgi:hypothetical protein
VSDPRVTVELLARADLSLKATLSEAWGKQWQEVLNDTGTGKCTLGNDDPNLALVEYGDYLRFSLDGVNRFISIIEKQEIVLVDSNEDVAKATTLSGRGSLAVFENAIAGPSLSIDQLPINDTRVLNWSDIRGSDIPEFRAGVGCMYDMGTVTAAGVPTNIPNPGDVHWFAPHAPDGSGDHANGDWYFLWVVCVPDDKAYRLYVAADDYMDVWLDNVPIVKRDQPSFTVAEKIELRLRSFCHFLSAHVQNVFGGPTRFAFALYSLNTDGTEDILYANSSADFTEAMVWDYPPEPPADFPGGIVRSFASQAASDGWDDPVSLDFSFFVDSDGVSWPQRTVFATQIGTDLLTVLKQLSETYFDMRMDPTTLTLHLYANSLGSASGVALVEGENLTELKLTGQG